MKTKPNWNEAPEWATELRLYNGVYRFRGNGMVTYKDGSHHEDALSPSDLGELVECRPKPFTINAGDYIDSREFTREECERFCGIAVECGFKLQDKHFGQYSYFGINEQGETWACYHADVVGMNNNVTTQFREFLDKEKGMSTFTKDDLKAEQTVTYRDGDERVVFLGKLVSPERGGCSFSVRAELNDFNDDFTHNRRRDMDIIRVTDRDGTVLFEREPEPKEMTVADIERELGYSVKVVK